MTSQSEHVFDDIWQNEGHGKSAAQTTFIKYCMKRFPIQTKSETDIVGPHLPVGMTLIHAQDLKGNLNGNQIKQPERTTNGEH